MNDDGLPGIRATALTKRPSGSRRLQLWASRGSVPACENEGHDLRTPVTTCADRSARLVDLIEELLDSERIFRDVGRREPIGLHNQIRNRCRTLRIELTEPHVVQVQLGPVRKHKPTIVQHANRCHSTESRGVHSSACPSGTRQMRASPRCLAITKLESVVSPVPRRRCSRRCRPCGS